MFGNIGREERERERRRGEKKRDREEAARERENGIRFREGEILLVFSSGPVAQDNAQKICPDGTTKNTPGHLDAFKWAR